MRRLNISKLANFFIWFQVYFNIFCKFLIFDLGFPNFINYISDLLTLCLIVLLFKKYYPKIKISKKAKSLLICVFSFFIICTFSTLINKGNFLLFLWGFRNTFRFLIWLICCIAFLDTRYLKINFNIFKFITYVNIFFMLYQFIVLGIRNDYLNGVFGTYVGGNAAINIFLIAMTVFSIYMYRIKEIKKSKFIFLLIILLLSSSLNELKIFFLEFFIIIFISQFYFSEKKVNPLILFRNLLVLFISIYIALQVFFIFYPDFANFFTIESILDYTTRSYNSNELLYSNGVPIMNRFSVFEVIPKYFLTSFDQILFGKGFGSSEFSQIAIFNSAFYQQYGAINYLGYFSSYLLLEVGILGVGTYLLIFILSFFYCFRRKNQLNLFALTLSLMGIILFFYNSSFRLESCGYMFYTFLAISFTLNKNVDENMKRRRKNV